MAGVSDSDTLPIFYLQLARHGEFGVYPHDETIKTIYEQDFRINRASFIA
jgi:hypothetical protein